MFLFPLLQASSWHLYLLWASFSNKNLDHVVVWLLVSEMRTGNAKMKGSEQHWSSSAWVSKLIIHVMGSIYLVSRCIACYAVVLTVCRRNKKQNTDRTVLPALVRETTSGWQ